MEAPTKKEKHTCPNCYYPRPHSNTDFCASCGQKFKSGRITFVELISEAFSMLFNLDNKFFSTLAAIFIPARLTRQFFKGKRQSYVHPVRVLLVSTLVFIFALSHSFDDAVIDNPADFYDELKKSQWEQDKAIELDSLKKNISRDFNENKAVNAALDSLIIHSNLDEIGDDSLQITKENISFLQKDIAISREDFFNLSGLEIVNKYKVEGFLERTLWRQSIRVIKRGNQLVGYLIGNILWMVILMMPLLALVLRLLYVRRDFYYVEHLVFSMHTHSFGFVLLSIYFVARNYIPTASIGFVFLIIGLFLLFSMKKFYGQSKRKTVLKFFVVNFTYIPLICLVLIVTILLSLALF